MQTLNTLIVPTAFIHMRKFILLLIAVIAAGSSTALAGVQHYQAPLHDVTWKTSSKKLHCSLSHDIPLYGRAIFSRSAGEKLMFTMEVKQAATRKHDQARLRILPPEWKHQVAAIDLDNVAVHRGKTPFQLEGSLPGRMLAELQKGMFPTFSYRDWIDASDKVSVALPGIHIKKAMDTFISCLAKLPVYQFADFKNSLLHFDSGKHLLSASAKKRLDDLVRFLKSDEDDQVKTIEVVGHTDSIGRKRKNDALGQRRSEAVRDYLVAKGVPAEIFKLVSRGERKPVKSNHTDQGRAENRRALVTLIR